MESIENDLSWYFFVMDAYCLLLLLKLCYFVLKLLPWCIFQVLTMWLEFLYLIFQNINHIVGVLSLLLSDLMHRLNWLFFLKILFFNRLINNIPLQYIRSLHIKLFEQTFELRVLFMNIRSLNIRVLFLVQDTLLHSMSKWISWRLNEWFAVVCSWCV